LSTVKKKKLVYAIFIKVHHKEKLQQNLLNKE